MRSMYEGGISTAQRLFGFNCLDAEDVSDLMALNESQTVLDNN